MTQVIFDNGFKRIDMRNTDADSVRITITTVNTGQDMIVALTTGELEQLIADLNHVLDSADVLENAQPIEIKFDPNAVPDGALTSIDQLKKNVRVWEVYGHMPRVPTWGDGKLITVEPVDHVTMTRLQDGKSRYESNMADSMWYKTEGSYGFSSCDDRNIPKNRYNETYLFTSYDKAVKYANNCKNYHKR